MIRKENGYINCLVCNKKYKYCGHCNKNNIVEAWKNSYCSKECREIFYTCSNFEGNIISQEEAYNKLIELNIQPENMTEAVRASVDKIMAFKPEEEKPKRRTRRRKKVNEE